MCKKIIMIIGMILVNIFKDLKDDDVYFKKITAS